MYRSHAISLAMVIPPPWGWTKGQTCFFLVGIWDLGLSEISETNAILLLIRDDQVGDV